jgi:NAD(P)-dependent dehydrogenase (short-subunit alcohol dehydrogenase family)
MQDRVIVITGASGGIGEAFAEAASKRGARLVLAARRQQRLVAVAERTKAQAVVTDVTKRAEVERLVARAIELHGHIDVWVNNAGRAITRNAEQLTDEDVDDMMAVNFKGALYGMQAVLPHMKARGRGHIINVSTMLSRLPFAPIRSAYAASKAALNMLSAQLRGDLRASHPEIMVSSFFPGVVATDFGLNAKYGGPDNRTLPNAQPVDEVAQSMCELVEKPRAEAYSRAMFVEQVAKYYSADDVGAFEAQLHRR